MESVDIGPAQLPGTDALVSVKDDVFTHYLLSHWALLMDVAMPQVAQGDDTAPLRALVLACAFTTGDIGSLDEAHARLTRMNGAIRNNCCI